MKAILVLIAAAFLSLGCRGRATAPGDVHFSERDTVEPHSSPDADLIDERRAHRSMIEAHFREERDPAWASTAEASLRNQLAPIAQRNGARMTTIDCRTRTCVSTATFPSYEIARQNWGNVVTVPVRARCSSATTLEGAPRPKTSFDVQTVYTCRP